MQKKHKITQRHGRVSEPPVSRHIHGPLELFSQRLCKHLLDGHVMLGAPGGSDARVYIVGLGGAQGGRLVLVLVDEQVLAGVNTGRQRVKTFGQDVGGGGAFGGGGRGRHGVGAGFRVGLAELFDARLLGFSFLPGDHVVVHVAFRIQGVRAVRLNVLFGQALLDLLPTEPSLVLYGHYFVTKALHGLAVGFGDGALMITQDGDFSIGPIVG